MGNKDFNWWFAMMATFNTSLGLTNIYINTEQEDRQTRIEKTRQNIGVTK